MATETVRPHEELPVELREADDFSALLKQSFKPRTERAATEVETPSRPWSIRRWPIRA